MSKPQDPIRMVIDGFTPDDILRVAAYLTEPELNALAKNYVDDECTIVENEILLRLHTSAGQAILQRGGFLAIVYPTTQREGRFPRFLRILEALGISDSLGYSSMRVFHAFARTFMEEPELLKHFPAESLKILSALKAPAGAREAAIGSARQGNHISIEIAKSLVAEHGTADDGTDADQAANTPEVNTRIDKPKQKKTGIKSWSYPGKHCDFTIGPKQLADAKLDSIVNEWNTALTKFLRDFGLDGSPDAA